MKVQINEESDMAPPFISDSVEKKQNEENEEMSLLYNLERVDFLLKLLDISCTESLELQCDGLTARPMHVVQRLTPEMIIDRRTKLEAFKKKTLEKLNITPKPYG